MLFDFLRSKKKAEILPCTIIAQPEPPITAAACETPGVESAKKESSSSICLMVGFVVYILIIPTMMLIESLARSYVAEHPVFLDFQVYGPEKINGSVYRTGGKWSHSGESFLHLYFPAEIRINKSDVWPSLEILEMRLTFSANNEHLGQLTQKSWKINDDHVSKIFIVDLHSAHQTAIQCDGSRPDERLDISVHAQLYHSFWGASRGNAYERVFSILCNAGPKCDKDLLS